MASANEAGLDLREIRPLPRNILRRLTSELTNTGQRTYPEVGLSLMGNRGRLFVLADLKGEASHLYYLASVRNTAKSGMGLGDNRRLNHSAESVFVNVGDSHRDAKSSSPTMTGVRVGVTIVVRERESRSHGEGSQLVGTSGVKVTEC